MNNNYKKVSFLGEGGVGKSTILRLLSNQRLQKTYRPTIGVAFGSMKVDECDISLWDVAGQERFQFMWPGFIRGSNLLFLVTDSSPRNVLKTRQLIDKIEKQAKEVRARIQKKKKIVGTGYGYENDVKIIAIANKQDLPGSMKPSQVANLLGVPCYGMIAIDPKRRIEMYNILRNEMKQVIIA
ncbi:MAG: ADP-ribosylation factor-like protein [Candidatus Ranarchaeia archaeon]